MEGSGEAVKVDKSLISMVRKTNIRMDFISALGS
jgi:hypothetical protein